MLSNSDRVGYDMSDDVDLPPSFQSLLDSSSLIQKKNMFIKLRENIKSEISARRVKSSDIVFGEYVEHVKDFLPANHLDDVIIAEVEDMGLLKKSNKPQSQWLSCDKRAYCFSDKPQLKHDAKDIKEFPTISTLMDLVNKDSRTTQDANSALVIVYNNNRAGIDFHDDGESLIDSNSSISTLTFGSSRMVDFCDHSIRPRIPQHTLECGNHDLMIMKPGCQQRLVHRVRQGTSSDDDLRIVISFRKLAAVNDDSEVSFNVPSTPSVKNGDSPPPKANNLLKSPNKVTIIAGDSFSVGLDEVRLGRKGRKKVINLSKGGASIKDVSLQLDLFFLASSQQDCIVEKVFVCVGANDIRHCRENGVRHLKQPLVSLVEQIKMSFPDANVWFQCLVPLPLQHQYSVVNVEQYNKLLFEVCSFMKVYYLDVFKKFLIFDNRRRCFYRDEIMFVDRRNIHLNKLGLSLLARFYIRCIHSERFNPLGF